MKKVHLAYSSPLSSSSETISQDTRQVFLFSVSDPDEKRLTQIRLKTSHLVSNLPENPSDASSPPRRLWASQCQPLLRSSLPDDHDEKMIMMIMTIITMPATCSLFLVSVVFFSLLYVVCNNFSAAILSSAS